MLVPNLSHTSVDMMGRCARQFYYRYIEGLKVPPGAAFAVGLAYHHAIGENFEFKIKTKQDLATGAVWAIFSDQYEREADQVDWLFEDSDRGNLKDVGLQLVGLYLSNIAPIRNPKAVELEFDVAVPYVERRFRGRIDYVGEDDLYIDHKTSSRKWNQSRADTSLQASAYYLAAKIEGEKPSGFCFDIAIKKKTPEVQVVSTHRSEIQVQQYIDRLQDVEKLINAEIFPKTDPSNWVCSPRWCGYYSACMQGAPYSQLRLLRKDTDDATSEV